MPKASHGVKSVDSMIAHRPSKFNTQKESGFRKGGNFGDFCPASSRCFRKMLDYMRALLV